jgi:hypothetical protein
MKWQHWLDPVGQYTSLIVAVKSQFVFVAHIVGFSSTGNPACAPSCSFRRSLCEEAMAALGGFGSGESRTRGRLGRFSQASTRRHVLSCWRTLRPTLPKRTSGRGSQAMEIVLRCCVGTGRIACATELRYWVADFSPRRRMRSWSFLRSGPGALGLKATRYHSGCVRSRLSRESVDASLFGWRAIFSRIAEYG